MYLSVFLDFLFCFFFMFSSYAPILHCFNVVVLEYVLISDRDNSLSLARSLSLSLSVFLPFLLIYFFHVMLTEIYLVKRLLELHYIYGLT